MANKWKEALECAVSCPRCNVNLKADDKRILSVYDHAPICMACKREEEKRPDYEESSRQMIGQCMADTEVAWSDPEGYCFHHFYGYTCPR